MSISVSDVAFMRLRIQSHLKKPKAKRRKRKVFKEESISLQMTIFDFTPEQRSAAA